MSCAIEINDWNISGFARKEAKNIVNPKASEFVGMVNGFKFYSEFEQKNSVSNLVI